MVPLKEIMIQGQQACESRAFKVPELNYEGVKEVTYTTSHPDVIRWSQVFTDRFQSLRIFERFLEDHPEQSPAKARVVGVHWHNFSDAVPWVLCQLSALLADNHKRHYAIQTAFEELGMRDEAEIHADLFWHTARLAGLTDEDRVRLLADKGMRKAMEFLRKAVLSCKTDSEVLGLLLGLEIPARENIETIFSSLEHRPELAKPLAQTKFFKFHRVIESEHIRLTVANFLRFCKTDREKAEFTHGCDLGLRFWESYWSGMSKLVAKEKVVAHA